MRVCHQVSYMLFLGMFATCQGMWDPNEFISPYWGFIHGIDHHEPNYVALALKKCPKLIEKNFDYNATPLCHYSTHAICLSCRPEATVTGQEIKEHNKHITDIITLLVQKGADIHQSFFDTKCKSTPLHFACANSCAPCIKALLNNGADAKRQGIHGNTPLHELLYNEPLLIHKDCLVEAVDALIKYGADLNAQNSNHKTPLEASLAHTEDECALLLASVLVEAGADTTSCNPLQAAIMHVMSYTQAALALAEAVLKKGASPQTQCGDKTALELAYIMRNGEMIALLKRYMQPPSQ